MKTAVKSDMYITYLKNFTHKEFEEAIIGGGACEPQK